MKAVFASEADLAEVVVKYLEADGYDVYQEVLGYDIVATRGPLLIIVECKLRLSFKVMDQAMDGQPWAHMCFVATPRRKDDSRAVRSSLAACGLGWLEVSAAQKRVLDRRAFGEFNRRAETKWIRDRLRPEHKTYARAGSPSGRTWTPFKETTRALGKVVKGAGKILVKEAIASIPHHYANARSAHGSLVQWAREGKLEGIGIQSEGRKLFFVWVEK